MQDQNTQMPHKGASGGVGAPARNEDPLTRKEVEDSRVKITQLVNLGRSSQNTNWHRKSEDTTAL